MTFMSRVGSNKCAINYMYILIVVSVKFKPTIYLFATLGLAFVSGLFLRLGLGSCLFVLFCFFF